VIILPKNNKKRDENSTMQTTKRKEAVSSEEPPSVRRKWEIYVEWHKLTMIDAAAKILFKEHKDATSDPSHPEDGVFSLEYVEQLYAVEEAWMKALAVSDPAECLMKLFQEFEDFGGGGLISEYCKPLFGARSFWEVHGDKLKELVNRRVQWHINARIGGHRMSILARRLAHAAYIGMAALHGLGLRLRVPKIAGHYFQVVWNDKQERFCFIPCQTGNDGAWAGDLGAWAWIQFMCGNEKADRIFIPMIYMPRDAPSTYDPTSVPRPAVTFNHGSETVGLTVPVLYAPILWELYIGMPHVFCKVVIQNIAAFLWPM